ncbi:hypothetical protein [Photobacterium angustum]|nr:hypothetical protein [Photobacterium angustum]
MSIAFLFYSNQRQTFAILLVVTYLTLYYAMTMIDNDVILFMSLSFCISA